MLKLLSVTRQLRSGFSPQQWTWRTCEHLRSHADSRALWMQVDLKSARSFLDVQHK